MAKEGASGFIRVVGSAIRCPWVIWSVEHGAGTLAARSQPMTCTLLPPKKSVIQFEHICKFRAHQIWRPRIANWVSRQILSKDKSSYVALI